MFIVQLLWDSVRLVVLTCCPRQALVAEICFRAGVARVVVKTMPDLGARILAVQAGEVDYVDQ